jgi:ABC-type multidrug transport system permease subunit
MNNLTINLIAFGLILFIVMIHRYWTMRNEGTKELPDFSYSYSRVIRYTAKWMLTLFIVVGVLALILTSVYGVAVNRGHPDKEFSFWAFPILVAFIGISYFVRSIFKSALENENPNAVKNRRVAYAKIIDWYCKTQKVNEKE